MPVKNIVIGNIHGFHSVGIGEAVRQDNILMLLIPDEGQSAKLVTRGQRIQRLARSWFL